MTNIQKALLFCSAVCYALVLYSAFRPSLEMAVIFFILHSITLLYFTYLSYRPAPSNGLEEELEALQLECRHLTEENDRLYQDLNDASSRLLAVSSQAESRQEEFTIDEPEEPAQPDTPDPYNGLLPPALSEATNGRAPAAVNLIHVVQDTIQEFTSRAESAGIHIQISSPTDTLLVKADVQRLRILFRNIIDNSLKYMKRAGNLIITLSMVGDDIFIVLKDNGDGLPEEETPHIFEMNYQGSNRVSGNGLGLTQAKAIVDYYGGTIYARSKPDKGMGIYIQIPTN